MKIPQPPPQSNQPHIQTTKHTQGEKTTIFTSFIGLNVALGAKLTHQIERRLSDNIVWIQQKFGDYLYKLTDQTKHLIREAINKNKVLNFIHWQNRVGGGTGWSG